MCLKEPANLGKRCSVLSGSRASALLQPCREARAGCAQRLTLRPRQHPVIARQLACSRDQREPTGDAAHLTSGAFGNMPSRNASRSAFNASRNSSGLVARCSVSFCKNTRAACP